MWLIAIKHIYTLAFGGGASTCKCMCGKWRFFILKIRQEKKEIKNTLHSVYMRGENLSGKKNREKVLFWHPCYENITPTGKYESKNKILSSLLLSKNWLFFVPVSFTLSHDLLIKILFIRCPRMSRLTDVKNTFFQASHHKWRMVI